MGLRSDGAGAFSGCRRRVSLGWIAVALFAAGMLVAPRTGVAQGAAPGEPGSGASRGVAPLEQLERAFQDVVAQVAPSVAGIRVVRTRGAAPSTAPADAQVIVNGSGVVLSENGLILTNEHVIQDAREIEVQLADGAALRATVVGADPRSDLAVLRVARQGLLPARLCDWSTVARGQWAIALGNPYGLGLDGQLSVSVGIIANLNRQLPGLGEGDDRFYYDMMQVTAPIHPGNSGGQLFNVRGELCGIVTAMHTRAPADEGVGFAIPLGPAKRRIIATLAAGQAVVYGYIGATVRALEPEERAMLGSSRGVVIEQLDFEGPAAAAGLAIGDLLVALDDQTIHGPGQLAELVGECAAGAVVHVTLVREGRPENVALTVGERDPQRISLLRNTLPAGLPSGPRPRP